MYEILPIGTVIKIKNDKNKYVIVGQYIRSDSKFYDYKCFVYPYGYVTGDLGVNINNSDIEIVYQLGDINY